MIARDNAIVPLHPAADYTGKEGYFVKIVAGEASLCTGTTDAPIGVITEGCDTDGKVSVAVIGAGLRRHREGQGDRDLARQHRPGIRP